MKKIFKLTLFKKIFLIIFVGMLSVESFHVYLDYKAEIKKLMVDISFIDPQYRQVWVPFLNQYNEQLDPQFIELYDQVYNASQGYHAIVKDGEIVNVVDNIGALSYEPFLHVLGENGSKAILRQNIDKNIIKKLDQYIYYSYKKDRKQPIYIEIAFLENSDDNIPIYLRFDDVEYKKQDIQKKEKCMVELYYTSDFEYSCYSGDGYPRMFDYKKKRENCRQLAINHDSFNTLEGYYAGRETKNTFVDGELYILNISSFKDSIEFINIYPTGYTQRNLIDTTIRSKRYVYPLAIVLTLMMSILISYMLTRRIRKIDKTTKAIASGDFDLVLSEKNQDEIGGLSRSINTMSRQLKQTIEKLNDEIEHVKELESLRKEFINQFTHEMKTPLGIINGYSELLDEAQSEEEKEKYLQIINRETNHINKLIESMLNLSRLEAGKVELHLEMIDLEDMITEIVDEYEVLLMKKEVKVDVKSINPCVQGDKELIKTVIHNFLSNAIKHVDQGGCINIELDHGCSVYNEGDLIEEKNLKSIWHTFVTHDQQGSGLGLAICSSILELHGFNYGVDNVDDGVCFYFKEQE